MASKSIFNELSLNLRFGGAYLSGVFSEGASLDGVS